MSTVLPRLSLPADRPLRLVAPLGFIESDYGDGAENVVGKGIAALVSAAVFGVVEGIRLLQNQSQRVIPRETVIQEKPQACGVAEAAGAYLANLQRDNLDQSLRSIPSRTHVWALPSGHAVEVRQTVGKDGLTFDIDLKEPQGKRYRLQSVRAEVTEKGIKVPVGRLPLRVGSQSLGVVDVALRVGPAGLNEVSLTHTGSDGKAFTVKLKTRPCDPDVVADNMVRMNVGGSKDARFLGEKHLARSARARNGNLHQGLTDLLMQVRPSASGVYRNHGSSSLDLLSRPLEQLRKAGTDMSGLHAIQTEYSRLARLPGGKPVDVEAFRAVRQRAWGWLQQSLRAAIDQGFIDPRDLANRFGVNYGLDAVRKASAQQATSRVPAKTESTPPPYRQGEGIGTPFGRLLWVGRNANGDDIVQTRTTSYVVPSGVVDRGRDALRAWVLRSVEGGHIRADDLYGASQARYLQGERIGTPYGDVFFDSASRSGAAQVRGRSLSYRIKPGVDLGNRDAVRGWLIRAIEHGQIDRAQLFQSVAASDTAPVNAAWPIKVKTRQRAVERAVRQQGWDVRTLPDGRLFIWRGKTASGQDDVARSLAAVLDVPRERLRLAPASEAVHGQATRGFAVSAHVLSK
jgi:hypothetical protein